MSGLALVAVLLPAALAIAVLTNLVRRRLLATLPFLVPLNGLPISVGVNVHIDQLLAALLTVGLALSVLAGRRRLYLDPVTWCIIVLIGLNLLSTAVNSPVPAYSFQQVANATSAFAVYVVITNDLDTREAVDRFFSVCVLAGIVYTAFGVLMFGLALAGQTTWGANVGQVDPGFAYGAYGTLYEPNVFGSYCQLYFIAALAILLLHPPRLSRRAARRLRLLALTSGLGLFVSFTRGAWLGAAGGIVAFLVVTRWALRRPPPLGRILVPVVGFGVVVVALALSPSSAGEFFRYKVTNLVNAQSTTATIRLVAVAAALAQVGQHPILGWGTYTFAPMIAGGADFKEIAGTSLWLGNYLLLVLHDTGVIGLAVVLVLLWCLMARGCRAIVRLSVSNPDAAIVETALVAAFAGVLVTSLFAGGFNLGYWWLFAGLIGAYAQVASPRDVTPAAPRSPVAPFPPSDAASSTA